MASWISLQNIWIFPFLSVLSWYRIKIVLILSYPLKRNANVWGLTDARASWSSSSRRETDWFLPLLGKPRYVRYWAPAPSSASSCSAVADRHPGGRSKAQPSCAWSPPSPEWRAALGQASAPPGENATAGVRSNREEHLGSMNWRSVLQPVHIHRPTHMHVCARVDTHTCAHTHCGKYRKNSSSVSRKADFPFYI